MKRKIFLTSLCLIATTSFAITGLTTSPAQARQGFDGDEGIEFGWDGFFERFPVSWFA